ncbi:putative metal-dependent hydrolase [Burkholderiales bacterium]|nr:putative metal-dependent hydrolase [Burkholderiales bacterium]
MKSVRLRVVSYNIHKGVTAFGRRSRVSELRMALHRIDADLVFLQEVQDRNERSADSWADPSRSSQLDVLASSGYEHRAYGVNAVYPHGHHGNAILSRWRIEHFANHDISDHMLERRGMLHAVAQPPETGRQGIHLICAHFGLAKRSRMRQADWVAHFVEREIPPTAPLILAGDFNDWQRGVDAQLRQRLGMREVFDEMKATAWLDRLLGWRRPVQVARTFPSLVPCLTLDRIYVRGLRARRSLVPRGRSWARCSDHAPLIADLEL